MDFIGFEGANIVYGENQEEYLPLPVYKRQDGHLTSCIKLSWKDLLKIVLTRVIWLDVLTFNKPLQPLKISLIKPNDIDEG